ncbi:P-loop NTPase family protein [Alistipes onderdonkii]|uniref:hypothetical protein n=1 Tax=Alistipes onderdonkii TaxID=328813 RepID=UPI001D0BEBA2|nr:hypothetical protein [Alistipes onderdonkii]
MSKEPISISFANQKGGIGKSTFTILAASWLRCRDIFQRVLPFYLCRVQNRSLELIAQQRSGAALQRRSDEAPQHRSDAITKQRSNNEAGSRGHRSMINYTP